MGITVTNLTVQGTACPWKLGSSSDNPASGGVLVAQGSGNSDGSAAASGSAGQNSSYKYGRSHTNPSETTPTTLAVTPGQMLMLAYTGGTVATGASGAGNSPPSGSPTTTLTPAPGSETTGDGYVQPVNMVVGRRGFNATGTVNTSGTAVTWVSGTKFTGAMIGSVIWINNAAFTISTVTSQTTLTLTATAGSQSGVTFFFYSAMTTIGGLVGAFTDSSGNIVSTFDWNSWAINAGISNNTTAQFGTPGDNRTFTITSVNAMSAGTTIYNFSNIPAAANNAYVGFLFTISGFTNAQNNGTFFCTASTSTTITLNNGQGVAETATKTMTMVPYITIPVPASAAFLSLGISDGVLNDNTGSYSLTAFQFANEGFFTSTGWLGDRGFFRQFPAGQVSPESMKDFTSFQSTNINQSVALATYFLPQMVLGVPLIRGKVGQLFPHGGQNFGGNPTGAGQNFPY